MAKVNENHKNATVKISYSFLKIMTGSDLSRKRLPLMTARSAEAGPVVWLTACSHGDEISGIVIIQEIFKRIRRQLLKGTIHAFPLMNPMGFETGSRDISVSSEDLNRSFPGKENGSLGERIAHQIFSKITEISPSLVLDFHNDWVKSIPYVIIDGHQDKFSKEVYEKSKNFAGQTGIAVIEDTDELPSSLSHNLLLKDIPALTLELGEPNLINEQFVTYGLEAIRNILAELEMIDQGGERFSFPLPPAYMDGMPLRYSDKPYSSKSGIIRFQAKPGDQVRKGQPIARIVNAFGKHQETVKAENDGIVLGHSDSSVVFPGMPIMAFGIPQQE